MKETVYDPETAISNWLNQYDDPSPKFNRCEIEHGSPLASSENRIVNGLIGQGYEVHETTSTFYLSSPGWIAGYGNSFAACVREEFQVALGAVGWLRFRLEGTASIFLTLFYILPEHQAKGHARTWFPKITDALFRAGAESMRGIVMPSMLPAQKPMDVQCLTRFYMREGFAATGDGHIVKNSPYLCFG